MIICKMRKQFNKNNPAEIALEMKYLCAYNFCIFSASKILKTYLERTLKITLEKCNSISKFRR